MADALFVPFRTPTPTGPFTISLQPLDTELVPGTRDLDQSELIAHDQVPTLLPVEPPAHVSATPNSGLTDAALIGIIAGSVGLAVIVCVVVVIIFFGAAAGAAAGAGQGAEEMTREWQLEKPTTDIVAGGDAPAA